MSGNSAWGMKPSDLPLMSTTTNLSSRISVTVAGITLWALSAPKLDSASSFSMMLIVF